MTDLKHRLRNAVDPGSREMCLTALEYIEQQESAIRTLREALQRTRKSLNSRRDDVYVMQVLAATENPC
jgi:hypothetical protein